MVNIIKADIYRIFRGCGIYIAIAIMLLMISISIYLVEPGAIGATAGDYSTNESYTYNNSAMEELSYEEIQEMSSSEYREAMLNTEGYELDRDILSNNMNLYYVFIFVAALAVTMDFSTGSIKNTLSSAISRKKYFFSKTALIAAGCLLLFFLNTYITYFANIIFNGTNLASSLQTVTKISLLQLPPVFALISILAGIAFTVKKTAPYNTITIPFIMIFQILLNVVAEFFNIPEKYLSYELQIMFAKLANHPSSAYLLHSYIVCGMIIVVFMLLGYFSFRKTEIK